MLFVKYAIKSSKLTVLANCGKKEKITFNKSIARNTRNISQEKNIICLLLRRERRGKENNMTKKLPKPKINDTVEMCDMTKMFGKVKRIINNDTVLVQWGDDVETVRIKDLALVERK